MFGESNTHLPGQSRSGFSGRLDNIWMPAPRQAQRVVNSKAGAGARIVLRRAVLSHFNAGDLSKEQAIGGLVTPERKRTNMKERLPPLGMVSVGLARER